MTPASVRRQGCASACACAPSRNLPPPPAFCMPRCLFSAHTATTHKTTPAAPSDLFSASFTISMIIAISARSLTILKTRN